MTGSSGTSGAWAARLAAPQRRPSQAVAASRKLWNTAYPGEPYDSVLEAVAAPPAAAEASRLPPPCEGQSLACKLPRNPDGRDALT